MKHETGGEPDATCRDKEVGDRGHGRVGHVGCRDPRGRDVRRRGLTADRGQSQLGARVRLAGLRAGDLLDARLLRRCGRAGYLRPPHHLLGLRAPPCRSWPSRWSRPTGTSSGRSPCARARSSRTGPALTGQDIADDFNNYYNRQGSSAAATFAEVKSRGRLRPARRRPSPWTRRTPTSPCCSRPSIPSTPTSRRCTAPTYAAHPDGTGPFELVSWTAQQPARAEGQPQLLAQGCQGSQAAVRAEPDA